jgi:hypothetical protein
MPNILVIVVVLVLTVVIWMVISRLRSNKSDPLPQNLGLSENRIASPPPLTPIVPKDTAVPPSSFLPVIRTSLTSRDSPPPMPELKRTAEPDSSDQIRQSPSPPPLHPQPGKDAAVSERLQRYLSAESPKRDMESARDPADENTVVLRQDDPDYQIHRSAPEGAYLMFQPVSNKLRIPWLFVILWASAIFVTAVLDTKVTIPYTSGGGIEAGKMPKKPVLKKADRDNPKKVIEHHQKLSRYQKEVEQRDARLPKWSLWMLIFCAPPALFLLSKWYDATYGEDKEKREIAEVAGMAASHAMREYKRKKG